MSLIPFAGAVQKFNRQRDTQYKIERSLRFNSADSAYLNRTPGSAPTAATKGTWSFWIKRTKLATEVYIIGSRDGGNNTATFIRIESGDTLRFYNHDGSGVTWNMITTQVFRDVGAWMHIVVALDTTQATDTNRIKIYVNGTQVTAFGTASYPAQNATMTRWAANGVPNYIGNEGTTPSNYGDYYLAETHYIDGSALDPTSFGEFNEDTGVWQPKAYTGSYGTNGFYLDFSDNTSTTTLGYDAAGSNDWTLNNFSVTAGAGNDSLVDTPTNYGTDTGVGGEVRGNYNTWNPLIPAGDTAYANGNLDVTTSTTHGNPRGTVSVSSGKWYWEITPTNLGGGSELLVGIANINTAPTGFNASGSIGYYSFNGNKYTGGGTNSAYGNTFTNNDVIGVALDLDNNYLYFSKNGTFQNSGVPTSGGSGTGGISISANTYSCWCDDGSNSTTATFVSNFGQRPFAYTAPSGFKALCTQNLPEPTIVDGGQYFDTVLYTGNGSTQSITGVGFQPDWVWIKERNSTSDHCSFDAVRGVTERLRQNQTVAEDTVANSLTAFNSDGFSLGADASVNESASFTYVAWNWKAGNSNVTNTDGTITSTVRANPTAGFSIVTYSGSSASTVGHGLGVAPAMIIAKQRNNVEHWVVYHQATGKDAVLIFTTSAVISSANYWGSGGVTSTVFGTGGAGAGNAANNIVAYCFAAIPGYSAFGSYTGNGSADGPFVYLGFRPAFVMVKSSTAVRSWVISDGVRNPYNVTNLYLVPNSSSAEGTNNLFDFTSNGFKVRDSLVGINESSETFIYAAFSEAAFKYSLAR